MVSGASFMAVGPQQIGMKPNQPQSTRFNLLGNMVDMFFLTRNMTNVTVHLPLSFTKTALQPGNNPRLVGLLNSPALNIAGDAVGHARIRKLKP